MKKTLVGNDRIGRPVRLNIAELKANGKDYTELLFFGDLHFGHPQCDLDRAERQLDYCLQNGIYVLGMGDYVECGQRTSIGDSVYKQIPEPQKQLEFIVKMFRPLRDAGLLIGLHAGNHEKRITKETGLDMTKIMCGLLNTPYLGYACWSLLRVGDQHYTLYSYHGSSGSRFAHTKLKAVIDISHYFEADIIAMGHVHDKNVGTVLRQRVNVRNRTVEERKVHILLTGSYIKYDDTYAQDAGMPPAQLGSPKIKLFSERWDIHTSV